GQPCDNLVEKVPHSERVFGGDLHYRLKPKLVELPCAPPRTLVVSLVDGEQYRNVCRPKCAGNFLVCWDQTVTAVDDKDDDFGVFQGSSPGDHDQLVQGIFARAKHPP